MSFIRPPCSNHSKAWPGAQGAEKIPVTRRKGQKSAAAGSARPAFSRFFVFFLAQSSSINLNQAQLSAIDCNPVTFAGLMVQARLDHLPLAASGQKGREGFNAKSRTRSAASRDQSAESELKICH
jgi:hypothetical protein